MVAERARMPLSASIEYWSVTKISREMSLSKISSDCGPSGIALTKCKTRSRLPSAKVTFSAGSVYNPAPQDAYSCGVVVYGESKEATSGYECAEGNESCAPTRPP